MRIIRIRERRLCWHGGGECPRFIAVTEHSTGPYYSAESVRRLIWLRERWRRIILCGTAQCRRNEFLLARLRERIWRRGAKEMGRTLYFFPSLMSFMAAG